MTASLRLGILSLVALMTSSASAAAQPASETTTVTLMGARALYSLYPPEWGFFSHAMMCIAVGTNHGPEESCYGFYSSIDPNHPLATRVGGVGVVKFEFAEKSQRFAHVGSSLTKVITDSQRQQLMALIAQWNTSPEYTWTFEPNQVGNPIPTKRVSGYLLGYRDCLTFIQEAARIMGLSAPDRLPLETPDEYVLRLAGGSKGLPGRTRAPAAPSNLQIVW